MWKLTNKYSIDKSLIISLIGFLLVLIFYFIGGFDFFGITASVQHLLDIYSQLTGRFTAILLRIFSEDVIYLPEKSAISIHGTDAFILNHLSTRYYLYFFITLLILPGKTLKSLLIFLISFLIIWFLTIIKCSIEVYLQKHALMIVNELFLLIRTLFLFGMISFKVKINPSLYAVYQQLNLKMSTKFNFTVFGFILGLIIVLPFSRFFELLNLNWFINAIVQTSEFFTDLLGYTATVYDRYIIIDKNWVYLGDPCLGIGVILVFMYLIIALKGQFINQLIFILGGSFIMILMNAIRISFLLIYIYKHGRYDLHIDYHALSNYFFYTIVFIMLLIYLFWFQDLNIRKLELLKRKQ